MRSHSLFSKRSVTLECHALPIVKLTIDTDYTITLFKHNSTRGEWGGVLQNIGNDKTNVHLLLCFVNFFNFISYTRLFANHIYWLILKVQNFSNPDIFIISICNYD